MAFLAFAGQGRPAGPAFVSSVPSRTISHFFLISSPPAAEDTRRQRPDEYYIFVKLKVDSKK